MFSQARHSAAFVLCSALVAGCSSSAGTPADDHDADDGLADALDAVEAETTPTDTADDSVSDAPAVDAETGFDAPTVDAQDVDLGDLPPVGALRSTRVIALFADDPGRAEFGNAFDTELVVHNPTSARHRLFVTLYGPGDEVMQANQSGRLSDVCNPCVVDVEPDTVWTRVLLHDLINAHDGFAGVSGFVPAGWARVEIEGDAPDDLTVATRLINAHSTLGDLDGRADVSQAVALAHTVGTSVDERRIAFAWVEDDPQRTTTTFGVRPVAVAPNARDVTFGVAYAAQPGDGPLTVELWLGQAANNEPIYSSTGDDACAPCTYVLGDHGSAHVTMNVGDLVATAGGFGTLPERQGRALVVLKGGRPAAAAVQAWTTRTRTGPTDVDVALFNGTELTGLTAGAPRQLWVAPYLDAPGLADAAWGDDTTLHIALFDRVGTQSPFDEDFSADTDAAVGITVLDAATGDPLVGSDGWTICDPCVYLLATREPTEVFRLSDFPNYAADATQQIAYRIDVEGARPDLVAVDVVRETWGGEGRRPNHGVSAASAGPRAGAQALVPWWLDRPGDTLTPEATFDAQLGLLGLNDAVLTVGSADGPLIDADGIPACSRCVPAITSGVLRLEDYTAGADLDPLVLRQGWVSLAGATQSVGGWVTASTAEGVRYITAIPVAWSR